MGIVTGQFSRPAKFSTIIADADLDIGAKAILSTNLSFYEGSSSVWVVKNRAKAAYRDIKGYLLAATKRVSSDEIIEYTSGSGIDIDGLLIKDNKLTQLEGIAGVTMPKIVSDNLRNSHDAEDTEPSTGATYVKVKTMTFTNGIKGTLRVKFDIKEPLDTYMVYGAIYKNGVLIGTPQSTSSSTYATKTEDIDFGTIAAGETIELWVKAEHGSASITHRNFRAYYDDDSGTSVMVTS